MDEGELELERVGGPSLSLWPGDSRWDGDTGDDGRDSDGDSNSDTARCCCCWWCDTDTDSDAGTGHWALGTGHYRGGLPARRLCLSTHANSILSIMNQSRLR